MDQSNYCVDQSNILGASAYLARAFINDDLPAFGGPASAIFTPSRTNSPFRPSCKWESNSSRNTRTRGIRAYIALSFTSSNVSRPSQIVLWARVNDQRMYCAVVHIFSHILTPRQMQYERESNHSFVYSLTHSLTHSPVIHIVFSVVIAEVNHCFSMRQTIQQFFTPSFKVLS